jgi:hypothetical protein
MDAYIEMVIILAEWTMDKVQKPVNPICHTPSSEPFRIYKFEFY